MEFFFFYGLPKRSPVLDFAPWLRNKVTSKGRTDMYIYPYCINIVHAYRLTDVRMIE